MDTLLNFPADLLKTNPFFKFTGTECYAVRRAFPNGGKEEHVLQASHCLEVVFSGSSQVTGGAHSQVTTAGGLLFRKNGSYQIKWSAGYSGLLFFVNNEFIAEFASNIKSYPAIKDATASPFYPFKVSPGSSYIVEQINEKVLSQPEFSPCIVRNLLLQLFFQVLSETVPKGFVGFLKNLLRSTQQDIGYLMESTYLQKLTLADLARMSGRSLTTFKKDFNTIFHISPFRWLLGRRLEHARFLLSEVDSSVSEVAFQSGFDNVSHFSKAYYQKFGLTPTAEKKSALSLIK